MTANRGPQLAAAMIMFSVCSSAAFSVRFMTRLLISKSLGRDDAFLTAALVLFLVYCSLSLIQVHDGLVRQMDALTSMQILEALRLIYVGEIFYAASATMLQISIASVLLRITSSISIRRVIWTVLILVTSMAIATITEMIFQCHPVSFFWDRRTPGGHCVHPSVTTAFQYAYASVSCLSNWTLGILPWFICRDLTNRRQRYQVAGLLCFANIGSVATTIRFYAIDQLLNTEDFLYASVPLAAWSAVEVGTGIMAVSIAALHPLQQWIQVKRGHVTTHQNMDLETVVVTELDRFPAKG